MEENKNTQQPQFKCSGDCLNCKPVQRQYCASQFTYRNMRTLESMQEALQAMQGTVDDIKAKIEAIQNNEANVFDPTANPTSNPASNPISPIAQSGDGAI